MHVVCISVYYIAFFIFITQNNSRYVKLMKKAIVLVTIGTRFDWSP